MRHLAMWVTLPFLLGAADPRAFLNGLQKHDEVKDTDFEAPLILASRAVVVATPLADLEGKLRDYLKSSNIPFKGHFSKTGGVIEKMTGENLDLPKIAVTGRDLDQLNACAAKTCGVKLTKKEAASIEALPVGPPRVAQFANLIAERAKRWVSHNELAGYEDKSANQESLTAMLAALPFMAAKYPETSRFLNTLMTQGAAAPKMLAGSFLRKDIVSIDSARAQPILRVTEDFELRENGALIFAEVPFYTNHYFDASLRVWEVFAQGEKSVIVLNDVMEIDELKKSGIIRALFHGKMEDGVSELESQELQRFK